jgi:hypothetical protein
MTTPVRKRIRIDHQPRLLGSPDGGFRSGRYALYVPTSVYSLISKFAVPCK